MSPVSAWCSSVESMLRCLTAVTPETGDRAFGRTLDILSGGASNPGPLDPAGEWFRSAAGEPPGYIFIGPQGRDHHFQAAAPEGVDPDAMRVMPPAPTGRLRSEIEAAAKSAAMVASGEKGAIEGDGGRIIAPCAESDRPAVAALSELLKAALLLGDPATDSLLLRQSAATFQQAAGQEPAARAAAAAVQILALRSKSYLVDAPLWAVAMLRQDALARLGADASPPLAAKLFDVSGFLSHPEEALRQAVSDLTWARQGQVVMAVCDAALDQAERAVESALAAQDVLSHQAGLYSAAGSAYLAMRVAEIMLGDVAPSLWPQGFAASVLGGYATKTEEIVVRAQHALAVACINAGNGLASRVHRAEVAAAGASKANELIEDYWFYPRAARPALLGDPAPTA